MKQITFRPLRRIKKTGKIAVASYMQWRKVKTADYNQFQLTIDEEYKLLPPDEYVYNHEGENLFWLDFDPEQIPDYKYDGNGEYPQQFRVRSMNWTGGKQYFYYGADGLDCDGVPTFTHYTQNHVAQSFADMTKFEPLTVGIVVKWFGWFLYQLENSKLQTPKH